MNVVTFIAGIVLALLILSTSIQKAYSKYFWYDEGLEASELCRSAVGEIIRGISEQANKSPFYYVLQKLSLNTIQNFDHHILFRFRLVSILSAFLLACGIFYFVRRQMGGLWAVFALITLASQNIFYHYSAESRIYMHWLFLFFLLVISTTSVCKRPWIEVSYKYKILFFLSCLTITLVIAMGVIQVGMALLTCLLCWYFIHPSPKSFKPLTHFAIPIVLICTGLELYYGTQGVDANDPIILGSEWDFLYQLSKGNYELIKMPPRLLLPKPGRDTFWGALITIPFVIAGLGGPFLLWKRKSNLDRPNFSIFIFSTVIGAQVLATFLIAAVIAILHYWFVQRIFLYLIVCYPLLAAVGGYFIFQYLDQKYSAFKTKLSFILSILVLLVCVVGILWHVQYHQMLAKEKERILCPISLGRLSEDLQYGEHTSAYESFNLVVKVSERLNHCNNIIDQDIDKVYITKNDQHVWSLSDQVLDESAALKVCGETFSYAF
jgi:hypothetical protein